MPQSRLSSGLEAFLNIASGFIISALVWQFVVCPMYGIPMPLGRNIEITSIFTVTSFIRSYAWRRWFNGLMTKRHRNVTK